MAEARIAVDDEAPDDRRRRSSAPPVVVGPAVGDPAGRSPRRVQTGAGDGATRLLEILIGDGSLDDAIARVLRTGAAAMRSDAILSLALLPADAGPGRTPHTGATEQRGRDLHEWQTTHDEGPTPAAGRLGDTTVVDDCGTDRRFGRFGRIAASAGIGSCAAWPMRVEGRQIGTITSYLPAPGGVDGALVDLGEQLARAAAHVLRDVQEHERVTLELAQLTEALQSRSTIERAKGLLMGRLDIDDARAFDLLRAQSQHQNTKLREIAATLLARHESSPP